MRTRGVLFRGENVVVADFDSDGLASPLAMRDLPSSWRRVTLLFTRASSGPVAGGHAGTAIMISPAIAGTGGGASVIDALTASPQLLLRLQTFRHVLRASDARSGTCFVEAVEHEARAILDLVREDAHARERVRHQRGTRGARHAALAERACALMAASPDAPHRLTDDARTLAVSPFHLARVFRAQIGIPMHQYLLRMRLARALDEIASGEPSLSALALRLGFTSHSHFTVTFRRTFGLSPARFRETVSRTWCHALGAAASVETRRSA